MLLHVCMKDALEFTLPPQGCCLGRGDLEAVTLLPFEGPKGKESSVNLQLK